jgi:pimeloyl-ACP methyl ester carboxylesterase
MGFGMRGNLWAPQVQGLRADHQLVHFDNRGVGDSETAPGFWRMADLARDALRVMDDVGWDRAHVVGVSMGGMVAQHVALGAPERLQSLALIATHPGGLRTLPGRDALRLFARAQSREPGARVRALSQLLYPPAWQAQVDARRLEERLEAQLGRPAPRATALRQIGAILTHRTARRLPRLTTPTLVLLPEEDILVAPAQNERIARLIPGARLVRLPGAGHGAVFQAAETVNQELRRHFLAHEAPSR